MTYVASLGGAFFLITADLAVGVAADSLVAARATEASPGAFAAAPGPAPSPLAEVPGRVASLTAQAGDGAVLLSWRAPTGSAPPAFGYVVTASPEIGRLPVAGTATTITGLADGTTYVFFVQAAGALELGDAVASAPVTPSAQPALPEAPQGWRPVDRLRSEDGRLDTGVGLYYTLAQRVPAWEAVLDVRMRMVSYYFDGHNPGVFTPLLSESIGSVIDYWDGSGALHRFRVVAIRSWDVAWDEPPPVSGSVIAQFQTCRTLDGSVDWIYDAVAA